MCIFLITSLTTTAFLLILESVMHNKFRSVAVIHHIYYLQLFVSWVSCQPNKEVMKNNCIWTRMFIERKEMNNTFRNIQIQYTHSESNGESLDISQVQRTASPWVLICQPARQLCILLCRLTFTINSPFTSFADNL